MKAAPLPFDERAVEGLSDASRTAIGKHWERRARSELRVARTFALMGAPLARVHADAQVIELVARAVSDEERHSELCRQLAEIYGGARVPPPNVDDVVLPTFGAPDERLEVAILVAGMCCINETIATAWIEACLAVATAPIALAANRGHLRDEIDHARIGWAHLASDAVTPAIREELGAWVFPLLRANVPQWERPDPFLPEEGVPDHGHPSVSESRQAIKTAACSIILPGFEHVGIRAR